MLTAEPDETARQRPHACGQTRVNVLSPLGMPDGLQSGPHGGHGCLLNTRAYHAALRKRQGLRVGVQSFTGHALVNAIVGCPAEAIAVQSLRFCVVMYELDEAANGRCGLGVVAIQEFVH